MAFVAGRLVGRLLTVALLLGLALMVLLEFAGPELLHVLGATAANEDQARSSCVSYRVHASAFVRAAWFDIFFDRSVFGVAVRFRSWSRVAVFRPLKPTL